ncbi:NUMOD4 motif-containing HNH endonuclease [Tenacibaculum sp.]|uniref:NUMOD4 motif-containing HNH endonuclease n=1 Tax=Tenacibaculum sp. TaxID=1906242 RepID=UPI003D1218E0
MKEIFNDIIGFEGFYQVSNLGNVKSLERQVKNGNGFRKVRERILKQTINSRGYKMIGLNKNNNVKKIEVHQLVAIAFLNHNPNGYEIVVDHINNNKTDNRLINLQLITHRENIVKSNIKKSKPIGITYVKANKNWRARIMINGVRQSLGSFIKKEEAIKAYANKLKAL